MKTCLLLCLAGLLSACVSSPSLPRLQPGADARVFVWHDLITPQPEISRTFYQSLFGWEMAELDAAYATFLNADKQPVAGLYNSARSNPGQQSAVWLCVVKVSDLAGTVGKIRANGGTILREPSPAPGRGTIALIADPQGAILQLVEAPGGDAAATAPPWIWHELMTQGAENAAAWYAEIFDLEIEKAQTGLRFILTKDGSPLASVSENPFDDTRHQWIPVLAVENFDQVIARLPGLGGKILIAPSPEMRNSSVVLILDPENAPLILQDKGEGE